MPPLNPPSPPLHIDILTLFPEMFAALHYGIPGRAQKQEKMKLSFWNPRDWSEDPHRRVDDRPYGGGPGMVLQYAPLRNTLQHVQSALEKAQRPKGPVVFLSPRGTPLLQTHLQALSKEAQLTLVCGRYEGVDQRFIDRFIDVEYSMGDYIVSGGELPSMMLIDGIARLLPEVLGDKESAVDESFAEGLLEYPQYTRPEIIDGIAAPSVLLCGDPKQIKTWQHREALIRTWQTRPDLIKRRSLTEIERAWLAAVQNNKEFPPHTTTDEGRKNDHE